MWILWLYRLRITGIDHSCQPMWGIDVSRDIRQAHKVQLLGTWHRAWLTCLDALCRKVLQCPSVTTLLSNYTPRCSHCLPLMIPIQPFSLPEESPPQVEDGVQDPVLSLVCGQLWPQCSWPVCYIWGDAPSTNLLLMRVPQIRCHHHDICVHSIFPPSQEIRKI